MVQLNFHVLTEVFVSVLIKEVSITSKSVCMVFRQTHAAFRWMVG